MAEVPIAYSSDQYVADTGGGNVVDGAMSMPVNLDAPQDLTSGQPLYAFVEVKIGQQIITDFMDNLSDTVIDFSYTRIGYFGNRSQCGSKFSMSLYDDTALEIESLVAQAAGAEQGFYISYGWAFQGYEKYSVRDLYGIIGKYGLSFEGASLTLTIEGTISTYYGASNDQDTVSYDAETYKGKPSEVVKGICADKGWEIGLIEETEVVYDDDGSVKTFLRDRQDSLNFIQSLEELSVSQETGVQGYRFFIGEDNKVYFVSIDNTNVPAEASLEQAQSALGIIDDVSGGSSPQSEQPAAFSLAREAASAVETQIGTSPSSNRYWIGDSRFNGMSGMMGSNDTLIAKDSQGYSYLVNTAIPQLKQSLTNRAGETVVLGLGTNDVYNADKYISAYQQLMDQYPNVNFVVSAISPVYDGGTSSLTNAQIEQFNSKMKSAFPNSYVDIYSPLKGRVNAGNTDSMGVHYTSADIKNTVYSMLSNAAGGSGTPTVPSGTNTNYGNPVDGLDTGTYDIPSNMFISRKYEFYSGQRNNTVISFSPDFSGISAGNVTSVEAIGVDRITNEIIECSIEGKNPLTKLSDAEAKRYMGLSSSSKQNLEKKVATMWNYYSNLSYSATLEIMGDPTVKVGTYIYVMVYTKYGYPHHTSGVYYVKQAEDSISGGQFITTLILQKYGASSSRMAAGFTESDTGTTFTSQQGTPGQTTGVLPTDENVSEKGAAILDAAYSTPTAGAGYCAAWVSRVYKNAGLGSPGGNACDQYWNYCKSSDLSELEPGMIVAVPSHTHSDAGQQYGHVAIYIGNGMVRENVGQVKERSLESWIDYYGTTYTPKWGWAR